MLSMISALGRNRIIGKDNEMPWHLPADLQRFKQTTMSCPIIMGRKTYDSIGRPLPGRLNIVLSRDDALQIQGCTVVNSIDEALSIAKQNAIEDETNLNQEIFITGGSYLYKHFLEQADRLYLTLIDEDFDGDTYFPDYTQYQWKETERSDFQADDKNSHAYSFITLDRVR